MMNIDHPKGHGSSRRDFLKKSALSAAAFTIVPRHVLGGPGYVPPSDRIGFGFIGTGKLISGLVYRFLEIPEVQVLAGSDIDQMKLARFKDSVETYYSENLAKKRYRGCAGYPDYTELLGRKDIDAVVVATPDHWHAIQTIDALNAGKDVYCEKPLAHTIEEGRKMVEATRRNGRVLQTGSMQRSWPDFRKACELVRNGYLGDISTVLVNVGDPGISCNLPAQPEPEYLEWERWIGPAVWRSYNEVLSPPIEQDHFPMWRRYIEYGGGILADWGAHMFDIAQWALGMDDSGPVHIIPPEDPTATRGCKFIYANGIEMFHQDFGRGWAVRFIGTEGTLDISRKFLDSDPANLVTHEIGGSDERVYLSENHYRNFTGSIKDRSKPICDVETGHRSATVCSLGNLAYQLKRPLEWDPVMEQFKDDAIANRLRSKKYREGYAL
jgi:predicted dehydrogenase